MNTQRTCGWPADNCANTGLIAERDRLLAENKALREALRKIFDSQNLAAD